MRTPRNSISMSSMFLLVKAWGLGLLSAEIIFLSGEVGNKISQHLATQNIPVQTLVFTGICSLLVLYYMVRRITYSEIARLLSSRRIDLVLMLALGLLTSSYFGGLGTKQYWTFIGRISIAEIYALVALPILLGLLIFVRSVIGLLQPEEADAPSFFINDDERKSKSEDLLHSYDEAAKFAERVLNGGAKDSLVFGVDGPWGIGKSSFINLCAEYWQATYAEKIIVYRFEPLRFDEKSDLTQRFVDGLI